jgi:hypothetical protein
MALTKAKNRMIDLGYVNIRDFGAVGDGSTDDTSAIQAAIDYTEGLGAFNRKVVFLPVGNYAITELTWKTQVSLLGEDWRNTRLTGTGGSGSKMIKAQSGAALGGAIQSIENISFIPSGTQAVDGINLTDATNVNGCHFDKLWFNNCDTAITIGSVSGGSGFGDLWFGKIVVELSNNAIWLENGDDVHFADLLSFKNDAYALYLDDVLDFQLSRFRCTETGGVNSSQYANRIANSSRININSSQISQLVSSDRASGRLFLITSSTDINVSNFDWQGANGASTDTSRGLVISGTCDNLSFVNGQISNIIEADDGHGVQIGNGTDSVTRCKFVNVHTDTTGGSGFKQNNSADVELISCTSNNAMTGSVAVTRSGFDLRSNGKTIVIGGRVTGTNLTAGHGINCSSDSNKKIIGAIAGDGITATGATRVFVDNCDTQGNGNLAQVVTSTINPGTIASGDTYSTTVTLTGATLSDFVEWGSGTTTIDDLNCTVRVGATDTIDVQLHNPTGGGITPASSSWTFKLKKLS